MIVVEDCSSIQSLQLGQLWTSNQMLHDYINIVNIENTCHIVYVYISFQICFN